MTEAMKIRAIVPWFGGKRTMAAAIVKQLGPHRSYFELGCGSLAVLLAKEPSTHETAVDLHGMLINLARVVQDGALAPQLYAWLGRTLFGDDILGESREAIGEFKELYGVTVPDEPHVAMAYHYFILSWASRNGTAGMARENYQLAVRWTPNGGSPTTRWRNATDSIPAWHNRLRNVVILRRDMFDVLPKISDETGVAVYVDPPYLADTRGGSTGYLHDFSDFEHRDLAHALQRFQQARVVVSYYDDPCLMDLYPGWTKIDHPRHKHLHVQNRRGSARKLAPEVLLVNQRAT